MAFTIEKTEVERKGDLVMYSKSYYSCRRFSMVTRYWIELNGKELFSHERYWDVKDKFDELAKEET